MPARPSMSARPNERFAITRAPAFGVAVIVRWCCAERRRQATPDRSAQKEPYPVGACRHHPGGRRVTHRPRPLRSGGHRDRPGADGIPHRVGRHFGTPTPDDREYPWCTGHSDDGTVRLPQCRTEDGRRGRAVASAGTCSPGSGASSPGHAGGGAVDARGTAVIPIYGPSLDGTLPGNEVIISSSAGNRVTYARALGPMQFLPGTWARYASDGKGDGDGRPAEPVRLHARPRPATCAAAG